MMTIYYEAIVFEPVLDKLAHLFYLRVNHFLHVFNLSHFRHCICHFARIHPSLQADLNLVNSLYLNGERLVDDLRERRQQIVITS